MTTESLLVIILVLLTANLLFVGVYIVLVLKEVRTSIIKMNSILDTANQVTNALSTPVIGFTGAVAGVIEGLKAFKAIKSLNLSNFTPEEESTEE